MSNANRLSLVVALVATLLSCSDSDNPTIGLPSVPVLDGIWAGSLPTQPPGEDWSSVVLEFQQDARQVSGVLRPNGGVTHQVGGTFSGTTLILRIGDLPDDGSCLEIQMNVFTFEFDAENKTVGFSGTLSGECGGAVSGSFQFRKQ